MAVAPLAEPLDWLDEDREPDVTVELGVGLEGPLRGRDLLCSW